MNTPEDHSPLNELIAIMAILRGPDGCAWDRKQTPESLKPYIVEEAYELLEAIEHGKPEDVCDELGDLLLQVIFQAQIYSEKNEFDIQDVAGAIAKKLIRRHPHIFATSSAEGHEERWENIKQQERRNRGQSNRAVDRIPRSLPALMQASKAARFICFSDTSHILSKTKDELESLANRIQNEQPLPSLSLEQDLGQTLMSLAALAQSLGIDAEEALRKETRKTLRDYDAKNETS